MIVGIHFKQNFMLIANMQINSFNIYSKIAYILKCIRKSLISLANWLKLNPLKAEEAGAATKRCIEESMFQ